MGQCLDKCPLKSNCLSVQRVLYAKLQLTGIWLSCIHLVLIKLYVTNKHIIGMLNAYYNNIIIV